MLGDNGYRKILKDKQSLAIFLRGMAEFDKDFCELMASGVEFTLRLDIRGASQELVHCRVNRDRVEYNKGVDQRIDVRNKTRPSKSAG